MRQAQFLFGLLAVVIILLPLASFAALITTQGGVNLTVTIPGDSEAEEPEPVPGGGGGGGRRGGGVILPTGVVMSGRAYPLSKVSVLRDGQLASSTIAGLDSKFSISLTNISAGDHTFSVYGEDNSGRRSQIFTFSVSITDGAITNVSGIFISPTIATDKVQVRRGDDIAIFGQSTPYGQINIVVDSGSQLLVSTQADKDGIYFYNLNSAPLEIGQYLLRSRSSVDNESSDFGRPLIFTIGAVNILAPTNQICPARGDLNQDCRVDLVDFSIAAFWYRRPLSAVFQLLEQSVLSGDGIVDIKDFSIMAYYWTG